MIFMCVSSIYVLKNMIGKAIIIYMIWFIFNKIPLFYKYAYVGNSNIDPATLIAIYLAICIFVASCFHNEKTSSFHNALVAYAEAASNDQLIDGSGGNSYQNIARIWYSRANGWVERSVKNCISCKYCLVSVFLAALALICTISIDFVINSSYSKSWNGLYVFYPLLFFLIVSIAFLGIACYNTRPEGKFFRKFKRFNDWRIMNCCEPVIVKKNFREYIKNKNIDPQWIAPQWIDREFKYDSYWGRTEPSSQSKRLSDMCEEKSEGNSNGEEVRRVKP